MAGQCLATNIYDSIPSTLGHGDLLSCWTADPFAADQEQQRMDSAIDPVALVKTVIRRLRKAKPKRMRNHIVPLWSRVSDVFYHGSTYSREICRRFGFNPYETWSDE